MLAIGVRSSCAAVERNSLFIWSTSVSCVTSRKYRIRDADATSLWRAYELVVGSDETMAMRKVSHRRDIYPVFRELFAKGGANAEAS